MDIKNEIKKRHWVVFGAAGYPAFITPFAVVPSRYFYRKYKITNEAVVFWTGKTFDWLYDSSQLKRIAEQALSLMKKDGGKSYYNVWLKSATKFEKYHYYVMSRDLNDVGASQIIKIAKNYYHLFVDQYSKNNLIEPLSWYFQCYLKNLLIKNGLKDEHLSLIIDHYSQPVKDSYIKKCIKEFQQSDPQKLNKLLAKYHYINNDYRGAQKVSAADFKKLAKVFGTKHKKTIHLSKINSPQARELLEILRMVATIQDVRKAQSLMWVSGADKLLGLLSSKLELDYELLRLATWEEILAGQYNLKDLEKRAERVVILWHKKSVSYFVGQEARSLFRMYDKHIVQGNGESTTLKGIVASRGLVRGRVAVVTNRSHFHKVKKNTILVSVMTRPEYLQVMKVAAAFITDEGGITCHAAIVAREMKKPCIIGTKISTKILHDGDLVEVDANQGMVRILEKAK